MAIKIPLAIQGGGAKLCSLLGAMEAIRKLEQDHVVNVTRLAGTSAGSTSPPCVIRRLTG